MIIELMVELNQQLGRLIRQVREERHLTQVEFAKRLGTSQSAANRIEHGKQNLSIKTLERISKVLDYEFVLINPIHEPRAKVSQDKKTGKLTVTISPNG